MPSFRTLALQVESMSEPGSRPITQRRRKMRKEYEMTAEQETELLNVCKPTPVMYLSGGRPMFNSPQENANEAWRRLGVTLGFKHMTVRPSSKPDPRVFTAEPTTDAA